MEVCKLISFYCRKQQYIQPRHLALRMRMKVIYQVISVVSLCHILG